MLHRWLMLSLVFLANSSSGQTNQEAFCPALPAGADLRWESLRVPDLLVCRAISTQTGDEAFAITISRESPFKPRPADGAELSKNAQREVQWYRSAFPGQPEGQLREALIELSQDRVAHMLLRVGDQAARERYQQLVAGLDFAARPLDSDADETASAPPPAAESPQTAPEIDPASIAEEADAGEERDVFEESASDQSPADDDAPEAIDEPSFDDGENEEPEVINEPSFVDGENDGEAQNDEPEFEVTDYNGAH